MATICHLFRHMVAIFAENVKTSVMRTSWRPPGHRRLIFSKIASTDASSRPALSTVAMRSAAVSAE